MDYYLVDKFNRGRSGGGNNNKLEKLKADLMVIIQNTFEKIEQEYLTSHASLNTRITAIEEIGKLYEVTNNYFSTKRRRIVSVKPGVDSNDVIIKDQLNKAVKKLEKQIDEHIKDFENYKKTQ